MVHAGHLHPGCTFVPVQTWAPLQARHAVHSYPKRYSVGTLSGYHPEVVPC
jgi:hypothetical protein